MSLFREKPEEEEPTLGPREWRVLLGEGRPQPEGQRNRWADILKRAALCGGLRHSELSHCLKKTISSQSLAGSHSAGGKP